MKPPDEIPDTAPVPTTNDSFVVFFRWSRSHSWQPVRDVGWREVPINHDGKLTNEPRITVQVANPIQLACRFDDRETAIRCARRWLPLLRVYYPKCGLQVAYSFQINGGTF